MRDQEKEIPYQTLFFMFKGNQAVKVLQTEALHASK
jgi:hypothetical protein